MEGTSDSIGKPQEFVTEYVQNLLDVVSEQMKLHVQEISTLDKLNNLTLRK